MGNINRKIVNAGVNALDSAMDKAFYTQLAGNIAINTLNRLAPEDNIAERTPFIENLELVLHVEV